MADDKLVNVMDQIPTGESKKKSPETPPEVKKKKAANEVDAEYYKELDNFHPDHRIVTLVVDDSEPELALVRHLLKDTCKVITANTGLEGLKIYNQLRPEIVFLDIGLPKINGHKVLKEIMKINKNAYVVMFSSNAFKEDIVSSQESGAKGFIKKPFTKRDFMAQLMKFERANNKTENVAATL